MTPGLPCPNQLDDMRRHLELGERIVALTARGRELLAKGDRQGAQAALDECEELHEERQLLEERWRPAFKRRD